MKCMTRGITAVLAVFLAVSAVEARQNMLGRSAIGQVSAQLGIPFPQSLEASLSKLREPVAQEPELLPGAREPKADLTALTVGLPADVAPAQELPGLLPDLPAEFPAESDDASAKKESPRVVPSIRLTGSTGQPKTFPVRQAEALQPRVVPV